MTEIREFIQRIIRELDNESSFTILLSASLLPFLEEPLNKARFFDYDKKMELYFDSKDLNRFSRVKELTDLISQKIKGNPVKNFEKYLKLIRDCSLMIREKEGPDDGISWQGFGGVHSHYSLTPLGQAFLVFQASIRTSILRFDQIKFTQDWDTILREELDQLTSAVVDKRLKVRDSSNYFYAKREITSFIIQRIFEFLASTPKKVTIDDIRDFIWNRAGELHIGEIPEALDILRPIIQMSGDSFTLNERGKLARLGYANLIVEAALTLEDTELVHYMITSRNLEDGATNIIKQYTLWF